MPMTLALAAHVLLVLGFTLPEVLRWPWYRRIWNNVIATLGPVL